MKLLRLQARYRQWKARRKLERSGYPTWAVYRHNRDEDVCRYASTVDDFYSNYKYVYAFQNHNHPIYRLTYDWGPGGCRYGTDDVRDWLNAHSRFKSRLDCHRVWQDRGGDYSFNDIGGSDIIFAAFQDERDYLLFVLRWS